MQRLGLRVVALPAEKDVAVFNLQTRAAGQFEVQLSLGAFHEDLLAFDLHLDLGRDGNRLFSNA